jgi:integrase
MTQSAQIVLVQNTISKDLDHDLERLKHQALAFASESKSDATRRAYRSDWKIFETWCRKVGANPLPASPETVTLFITWMADQGRKPSTVDRKLVSVSQVHKMKGYPSPTSHAMVRQVLRGMRRRLGAAPTNKKAPILPEHLEKMLERLPGSLIGARNRCLLLVGFAGAFRRTELVSIDVEDLSFVTEGVAILIRRSKTDQNGKGRKVGIPYAEKSDMCPVMALRHWLDRAGLQSGPVFRPVTRYSRVLPGRLNSRTVGRVVKQAAKKAGYPPEIFGDHSLRSGFATAAAAAGRTERAIMKQTGHKNERVLRGYIRSGDIFRDNAESLL